MPTLGLQLTATFTADDPAPPQIDQHRELIGLARDLGATLLCAGQHFATPSLRYFQPVPYLASLAEAAAGMQMATGILLLPLLHPLAVAEDMATLDAITGGRINLGIGIGYSQHEFDAFQIDRATRTARFEEQIGIIRRLWDGKEAGATEFYSLDGVRSSLLPTRTGGIPIWIGAQARPSVLRAARLADSWYVPPFPTHRELIELWDLFRKERERRELPMPTTLPVRREVFVVDSRREAEEVIGIASGRYQTYSDWGLDIEAEYDEDRWMDSRFIVGDADTVAERLSFLVEHVPATQIVLKPQWPDQPHVEAMRRLEQVGDVLQRL